MPLPDHPGPPPKFHGGRDILIEAVVAFLERHLKS
jgi:hypothetical protein